MDKEFPDYKLKSDARMPAEKVIELYELLEKCGVNVWVDGGWGVDALLGGQTREHADLDIAIDYAHEQRMRDLLEEHGYEVIQTNDKTKWNYILGDGKYRIDVHVFGFDSSGQNIYGTKYPKESLAGEGEINGVHVRCVSAKWMIQFKSHPKQDEIDRFDQKNLCQKYGLPAPPLYKPHP